MWDWLNEPQFYRPALRILTVALVLLPVLLWVWQPRAAAVVGCACVAALLSIWREAVADLPSQRLHFRPVPPRPTGTRAVRVRLRLGTFGAWTTAGFLVLVALAVGIDPTTQAMAWRLGAVVLLGPPASLLHPRVTTALLAAWTLVSDVPLDALTVAIATTTTGDRRHAAFQRLYDLENRFFVAIAGYETSFTFRSRSDWLREDLPHVGRHG